MVSKKFTIACEISADFVQGITYFVNTASDFSSSISVNANNRTSDAKSLINIMALNIKAGTEIELVAVGSDANEAIIKLEDVLKQQKLI